MIIAISLCCGRGEDVDVDVDAVPDRWMHWGVLTGKVIRRDVCVCIFMGFRYLLRSMLGER